MGQRLGRTSQLVDISSRFRKFHASGSHSSGPAQLHAKLIRNNALHDLSFVNHLLDQYVKHQLLDNARKLFDEIPNRDVRTWTTIISGFAKKGSVMTVLQMFQAMQIEGTYPNRFTLSSVLKCCAKANKVGVGRMVHGWMLCSGVGLDVVLENSVLDMYVKCGAFESAVRLFEMMEVRNAVSWNIVIGGCFQVGDNGKGLELFRRMPCKDGGSWNTVIDGMMRNGSEGVALELLYEMVLVGQGLNEVTFSTALALASELFDLELGRQLHAQLLRHHIHSDGFLVSSLTHMYNRCGETESASLVFDYSSRDMNEKTLEGYIHYDTMDVAAWSSMVAGCVQNGRWEDALEIFRKMVRGNVEIHMFILTSILSACSRAGYFEFGQLIHVYSIKLGYRPDVAMSCTLIDMYAKCGSSSDARLIFEQTDDRNVVLWTAMISGYALNGDGLAATHLFDLMIKEGIEPNPITFISILTACTHAGLVEEGCGYFKMMNDVYGIKPETEHLTSMVDLYGRANHLEEAKQFIQENDISHLSAVWNAFFSSCRLHKNTEMAKLVPKHLLEVKQNEAGPYVLSSNLYAYAQKWEDVNKIRSIMKQKGIQKLPAQSWIQIQNHVHAFSVGDQSHQQC